MSIQSLKDKEINKNMKKTTKILIMLKMNENLESLQFDSKSPKNMTESGLNLMF